ncbi:hypothetical protein RD110_21890 [Rhodoferax koreense]|uniref:Uncharacterized protein n=2 Tax=Rhodoferax koreensis TaxID=1842727 RepID=A0A1P8K0K3_9BURK|nr:hypothetical protein RD110_21890 [Rhodoferax koreense]
MMQAGPSHVAHSDCQYAQSVGGSVEMLQLAQGTALDERLHKPPSWVDAADPIQAFMGRYSAVIAPGWRPLAERTLRTLVLASANCPERRRALSQLCVFGMSASLSFVVCTHADQTVEGILRKARVKSQGICEECGRLARLRQLGEEETATLCPRCAAPALLHHDIWVLLQSLRFLSAVNAPVVLSQIPPLLRPSFVEAALLQADGWDDTESARMTPTHFLVWAEGWRQMAEHISVPIRYLQRSADKRKSGNSGLI